MSKRKLILVAIAIPVLAIGWWLGSPLFLDRTVDEAAPERLTVLKAGEFRDADDFHQGRGRATLARTDDGASVLRFEDFEVTNGPDLYVLLSPAADVASSDELDAAGYVELGELKGNIGSQNYEIPADIEVSEQGSVIIYCKAFHVLFSVAPLTDVE